MPARVVLIAGSIVADPLLNKRLGFGHQVEPLLSASRFELHPFFELPAIGCKREAFAGFYECVHPFPG